MATTCSQKGIATLNFLEGCPLKAYRDVAGVWTIGAGLTSASGVIKPKAGMQISQAKADQLLNDALTRNYIPAVIKVIGSAQKQHVLDGAVSFHFNTGAIGRASWVAAFKRGNSSETRSKLALWRKAGGKVVKGLVRRREIEADMILLGQYPAGIGKATDASYSKNYARFVVSVSPAEINDIQNGFEKLGYSVKDGDRLRLHEVEKFQRDHNLTIDGLIGKATLSALQRDLDARRKSKTGAAATAGGGGIALGGDMATGGELGGWTSMLGFSVTVVAIIYLGYLIWTYRDAIAAKIAPYAPRIAKFLWSF